MAIARWYNRGIEIYYTEVISMATKICRKCGQEKSTDCFSRNKSSKDGLKPYCKQCVSEDSKKYREKYREDINKRKRISYHKSKEHANERTEQQLLEGTRVCTECGKEKPITDFYKRGNGGFYSQCKICSNKLMSEYFAKNHAQVIKRKRRYHKEHKSEIDAYNRQYYKDHKEDIKIRVKEWEEANPEQAKDNAVIHMHKKRFADVGLESNFTRADWNRCKEYFTVDGVPRCAYCGKPTKRPTIDHVIPLNKKGENTLNNIVPSCGRCNSSKFDRDFREWYSNQSFYSQERENKIITYLNS